MNYKNFCFSFLIVLATFLFRPSYCWSNYSCVHISGKILCDPVKDKKINIAYEELKETLRRFDNTSFQTMGLLLTTIGLFVASNNMRRWLESSPWNKIGFLSAIFIGAILHWSTILSYQTSSETYYGKLKDLGSDFELLFQPLLITGFSICKCNIPIPPQLVAHSILFLILFLMGFFGIKDNTSEKHLTFKGIKIISGDGKPDDKYLVVKEEKNS